MIDDLIKRLRDLAAVAHDDLSVAGEAADEIKRLRARIGELEIEIGQSAEDILSLIKQNETLRNALHGISLGAQNSMTSKEDLGKEARAALEQTK